MEVKSFLQQLDTALHNLLLSIHGERLVRFDAIFYDIFDNLD